MKLNTSTPGDIYYVALKMRDRDFEEIAALRPISEREPLARALAVQYGSGAGVYTVRDDDGVPVAVLGLLQAVPGVVSLLFFATDEFDKVKVAFTKFVIQKLRVALFNEGVRRIQCLSIDKYDVMHRWLRAVGMQKEAVHEQYGKNGETFFMFSCLEPAGHSNSEAGSGGRSAKFRKDGAGERLREPS